jgi:Mrp family chromosome partitioning ATPase
MLDATKSRVHTIELEERSPRQAPRGSGTTSRTFVDKLRQRRRMIRMSVLVGAVAGWVAGLAFVVIRVPAFSASSELLISNTTLQLSGPEAVVTQILVENSLIQSAIEVLRSGSVLERVIDKLGLDEITRISPRSYGFWNAVPSDSQSEAGKRQMAVALLRSNLTVKRIGTSQIISVSAKALSAVDAATLTNEIAGAFVQALYDSNAVVTTSAALRERIKVLGPTARIISEAIPPKSKDAPSNATAVLLGIVLGGLLGAAGSLVLTFLDRRLRAAEQAVAVTSAECFGFMPLNTQCSLSSEADDDSRAEVAWRRSVLRGVRSAALERSTRVPHIIGVTSCNAGEGKTTLANNLASFLAHDDAPVLLIDACCPDVAHRAAQAGPAGLHEFLRGAAPLEDLILDNIRPNLDFLPRGNGAEDLDLVWPNLAGLINDGRERSYEWVILDLPSLSRAVDVRSAGQVFDHLLIVVEWSQTSETQLHDALRSLGPLRSRVLGTIINKIPWHTLKPETPSSPQPRSWVNSVMTDPRSQQMTTSHDPEKVS